MVKLILVLMLMLLFGCGDYNSDLAISSNVFVSNEYVEVMRTAYSEVQKCTDLSGDPFDSLHIELLPSPADDPSFYRRPNIIFTQSLIQFKFELVHYLLDFNTGDPDKAHSSPFFMSCSTFS